MVNERFVYIRKRRRHDEPFNIFEIRDKKGKVPTMHFLTESDMMTVYDLLQGLHMKFEDC